MGKIPRGGDTMENAVSNIEVLDEGVENTDVAPACCGGGTGSART